MKNSSTGFSKYMVVFCVTTMALLFGLEWFLRQYIVTIPKSTPHIIKQTYTPSDKVLVIGDSHFYRGFVNSTEVSNLSKGGYTIPVIFEILKNVPNKKGKKIIFEASPQMFSKRHLEWGIRGFDNYYVLPSVLKLFIFEPGVTQHLKEINGAEALMKTLTKHWPDDVAKQSSWESLAPKQRQKLTQSRVELHRPMMETNTASQYQKTFEEMVEYASDHEMQLCFLRTPVDQNYLTMIANHPDYNESIQFFYQVALAKGIKYVDFRDLPMSFDFDQFINQDHLTPDASKSFVPLVLEACGF